MQLSPHFSLEELSLSSTAARHGIDNTPPPEAVTELTRLCETILEPLRTFLNAPLHIDSAFRCLAVNTLVKGAKTSQHMLGQAADVIPVGWDLKVALAKIRLSDLPFDQLIFECGAWIHISCAALGATPRRMVLIGSLVDGKWVYTPFKAGSPADTAQS
jgi:hypothetical protein